MEKVVLFPGNEPDMCEKMLDGKPEVMLSARGVVLLCLSSWRVDGNEKAHNSLRRYCEYIAMRGGYPGGASEALAELDELDRKSAIAWIKRTFALHVKDKNSVVQYIMS